MEIRELTAAEVPALSGCLQALADHHDRVSVHFPGSYPSHPYEVTLTSFAQALAQGTSRIAVAEAEGEIVGFCKADLGDGSGKLDYLAVLPAFRGRGYGGALMDWAMEIFRRGRVRRVEVKVVDGNDAIHLYERYGFRMNAHLLVREG